MKSRICFWTSPDFQLKKKNLDASRFFIFELKIEIWTCPESISGNVDIFKFAIGYLKSGHVQILFSNKKQNSGRVKIVYFSKSGLDYNIEVKMNFVRSDFYSTVKK